MSNKETKTETKITLKEEIKLRPAFIDEFLEADKQEKFWKAKKEELDTDLRTFLRENPLLDDIYLNKVNIKPKFDPVKLYAFFKKLLPQERLEAATIPFIDESQLDQLYAEGYFEFDKLPEDLYVIPKQQERLEIPINRIKKKKKDV